IPSWPLHNLVGDAGRTAMPASYHPEGGHGYFGLERRRVVAAESSCLECAPHSTITSVSNKSTYLGHPCPWSQLWPTLASTNGKVTSISPASEHKTPSHR